MMETNQAIKAFSQSEKLKSALIWASQLCEVHLALAEPDKPGAEKIIKTLVSMIGNEINVAQKAAPHDDWLAADKDVNTAMVMLNSGVAHESGYHLTQALSKVTNIGQQSMSLLIEKGLI
jgi:hypothetical protein